MQPSVDVSMFPDTTTGQQQMRDSLATMQKLNQGKRPPSIPKSILAESKRLQVYIWNIGPRKHTLENMGSLGAWNVLRPALTEMQYRDLDSSARAGYTKLADNLWCAPFAVAGIPWEPVWREGNKGEAQFFGEEDDEDTGLKLAQSIIGIGRNIARRSSLEKFGVFVSRTNPPSESEVRKATADLRKNFQTEVNEANEAHKVGKFLGDKGIAQAYHWEAARSLGKTSVECPWLDEIAERASTESCPFCTIPIKAAAVVCPNCKHVVNQEEFEKLQARGKKAKQ